MFQRLQLWKNERIGSFYSFVTSGRRLEGILQGRAQRDVWSDLGLFYCAAFLTAFSTVVQKLQINIHPIPYVSVIVKLCFSVIGKQHGRAAGSQRERRRK